MATRKARAPKLPAGKHIRCEGPRDFGAYYNGSLIGYRSTHQEAEDLLNGYVFDLLTRQGATVGEFAAAA